MLNNLIAEIEDGRDTHFLPVYTLQTSHLSELGEPNEGIKLELKGELPSDPATLVALYKALLGGHLRLNVHESTMMRSDVHLSLKYVGKVSWFDIECEVGAIATYSFIAYARIRSTGTNDFQDEYYHYDPPPTTHTHVDPIFNDGSRPVKYMYIEGEFLPPEKLEEKPRFSCLVTTKYSDAHSIQEPATSLEFVVNHPDKPVVSLLGDLGENQGNAIMHTQPWVPKSIKISQPVGGDE